MPIVNVSANITADSSVGANLKAHFVVAAVLLAGATTTANLHAHEADSASMAATSLFTANAHVHYVAAAALHANSMFSPSESTHEFLHASIMAGAIFYIDPAGVNVFHSAAPRTPPAAVTVPTVVPLRIPAPPQVTVKFSVSGAPKKQPPRFPR